jgi:hypothetical protein
MANRFPLVIDTTDGNKLKELPAGDNLDLRNSNIVRVQDVDALGTINAADITVNGNRLVAQTFINLTDTPADYIDGANKFVKVNATGDALEFRPFSDIGNIEVDEIEVAVQIIPETTGIVNIGTNDLYFNTVVANEFKGDLIAGDDTRVFNAATGRISYAALEGAPTQVSEFTNDIGYLLAEDLDSSLAGLFDEGATFNTDIQGSVFGDDSTMIVDGVASEVVGVINNTTITTSTLTAATAAIETTTVGTVQGKSDSNLVVDAQNDYDVVIGENNTSKTIIHNGQASGFGFETGVGIAEYSANSDLIFRAGNRIKFVATPVRFSPMTDTDAGYIVAQNGDVIYNTDQNRLQIRQNGAWIDLHKGTFDGNIATATGTSNFNDIVVAGDLTVQGTTTSIETTNTTITDNVIVLNEGEVGAGITNTTAGIEIDRGSEPNVTFVYDDSIDKWTIGTETLVAGTIEATLTGDITGDIAGDVTSTGTSSFAIVTISGDTTATGTVTSSAGFIGNVAGNVIGDVTGSVFGDDSTVLVDGNNNKVTGDVENAEVITTTVQGRNNTALNIYRGSVGSVVVGDASSGSMSVSDSGINITATAGVDIDGASTGTVNIGTGATTGNVTIGKVGNTTTIDGTLNAALTGNVIGNVTGDVTGNIDANALTIGSTDATTIAIGNSASTTTIEGTIQFTNALIANNLTADDSITITTEGNTTGEAISIGPGGSNTFINLTATNIRFFGNVTNAINATAGVVGDLKGSVVADDSTVIIDGVSGTVFKANIEDSANWDSAFGWGDHSTAGYIASGGEFTGDVKGSVFADDSSVMVNAVDFTMATDLMNLTPLNAEPANLISGMLVAADGTNWDPATKSGAVSYPVFYDGAAWNALY